ncbi:26S proteasome non-ATPase regulatory subunit 1 [Sitophilus oryzae]|uniref:26S proteasome non-ATPase regulatory subunit 1 n=1 Tax=Sitophilus oryzae TaxID=7048 RepID=A0A6J2X9I9_SITOR|nr:26S proteasome non-ATPase regulatory subunit 1 [Sitophilus oryzae]
MNITSAAGIISLLEEPRPELKVFALRKLDTIVDEFWPEISEAIEKIEILHEDKVFQQHQLAALVASKVYYHLGAFEDSLTYALGAGDLFDVNARNEYVETTISKCIDHYTQQRIALADGTAGAKPIDPRLEAIVNKMFQRCLDDGQYRQAMGLALETRRMDIFEASITQSDDNISMLSYAFQVAMSLIQNRGFRNLVLQSLVGLYRGLPTPDYVNMCQCLIFLEDPLSVAHILEKLVKGEEESQLMAYQIAFDLYESATQQFLELAIGALRLTAPIPSLLEPKPPKTSTEEPATENAPSESEVKPAEVKPEVVEKTLDSLSDSDKEHQQRIEKLHTILSGEVSIELHLQFLIRSNHADLLILKQTKETVRVSICHTATVIANAFMHSGTTSDQFLRDNLEWLARATNWAKLTATASLGVIHRGHENEALILMQSYLPKEVGPSSGYSEGGGLYALGLIHANHGANIIDYLLGQLKDAQNEYAQESQHEKILRGLAVGISFNMYGRLEEAEPLIQQLTTDKDPILRRSGMYTIAMAYCGTGHNQAIRKLLHVAVSDVNDDVRRAAVTALGFLLFRTPEQCPSVVSLLAESYNPHVRYGAAMALGIACAGTGLREAIALLEPMVMFDPVNFVRQGALIASAMILIQQTEQTCPKVSFFRQTYAQVISNKHEDVMAKFGAILAQGIIDAGGRNVTLSLQSRTGHTNMLAVVGTLVFTQYWYWFPLAHCLALAFTPTALIALNAQLKMPKLELKSNAKPSLYAYPAPMEEKKREEREKVQTAVLSIAARQRRRDHDRKHRDEKMDVDVEKDDKKTAEKPAEKAEEKKAEEKKVLSASSSSTIEEKKEKKDEKEEKKKEPEPNFEILQNPARILRQQLKVIAVNDNSQYVPLKDVSIGGIIMVRNLKPDEEELVEPVQAFGPKGEDEKEPEPPEPFEWLEDDV